MTKISKFIICCLSVILSISSFVVPTYCSNISSSLFTVDLINEFPNQNNYYNSSNINYISYDNFEVTRNLGNCLYATNVNDLPSSYYNGQVFDENYTISFPNNVSCSVTSSYHLVINSDHFFVSCDSWSLTWNNNPSFNMGKSAYSYTFGLRWIPSTIVSALNGKFTSLYLYGGFSFSYDIIYNGQYFYNDKFAFTSDISFITTGLKEIEFLSATDVSKSYRFMDNYGDYYYSSIPYTSTNYKNNYLCFDSLIYTDRYITSVQITNYHGRVFLGSFDNLNRIYYQFVFKYVDYDQATSINLFSGSSTGSGGPVGSLIPNGSNNFYKTAEWWDIPSHLYNFFIYLIMDAPIISYFTKLGMFIINFLVESFNFIINLFNGVSNIFFVSIFVGILALIFLLKIIFGGKS